MSSSNRVAPGTYVSVSTSVKRGYETLPSLPSGDAKMSFLGLGLQEVHELANNDSDAVGAFYGRGGPWFSLLLQGAQNSLGKIYKPYSNEIMQTIWGGGNLSVTRYRSLF